MKKYLLVFILLTALLGVFSVTGQSFALQNLVFCGEVGTRSEGWYRSGLITPVVGQLIKYDNCSGQSALCLYVGTQNEGWYSSPGNNLINREQCGSGILPSATPAVTPITTALPSSTPAVPYPCYEDFSTMKYGWQGEGVRELQVVLGRDRTIYPEGLITGFFGEKTKMAVKNLQRKVGLPETGVVDQDLKPYLFPCYKIFVIYPNGGESFKAGDKMKISWHASWPDNLIGQSAMSTGSAMPPARMSKYLLSIDLIEIGGYDKKCQTKGVVGYKCPQTEKVVFHIRNVSTNNDEDSIEWLIPASISESKNYKIRISSGLNNPCPPGAFCVTKLMPTWNISDDSDGVFAILGGLVIKPTPNITPETLITPLPEVSLLPEIVRIRAEVSEMIKRLQEILEKLIGILGR
ncbi:MAG: hypothetical protein A2418_00010 [Candidatus Brennerbacteria bacterium RIFOXYC1_FULL_41_11]|uniref:Peptidoglycan binding-like domain-containing protein n=1 Tax=Candidatus Brennerbacteria bacterium RIFOXYD1_FULL_41_16 TaxID=1797529 RepID=A0A1G1XLZ7_9BACT|nr:MAG: hypothetical protein A2391_00360 [Candidatus Brennerbacteria bacterium RIFOXYB1_FULL_41_13]OGY40600.1 MAG: hypothetical protein A2418_00010 [Candidatus Brennerbacteria bacterium RIFOXYC1_FULL_41_11]OGY41001.1 MAG: hypothetical protein A2570_01710 [Candidatus Brennerbacteria bacterium RIFOXYD1_FULL_41_16]